MTYPVGYNFRATVGYVTDGTDEFFAGSSTYPTADGYGHNVGWETGPSLIRNRNASFDRRLAGGALQSNGGGKGRFRVDLAATGDYDIRLAMGDTASHRVELELLDTTTSLGVLMTDTAITTSSYYDATATLYTAANWPGSNTKITKTFTTTILRVDIGNTSSAYYLLNHLFIDAVASAGTPKGVFNNVFTGPFGGPI